MDVFKAGVFGISGSQSNPNPQEQQDSKDRIFEARDNSRIDDILNAINQKSGWCATYTGCTNWSRADKLEAAVYILVAVTCISIVAVASQDNNVQDDTKRLPLAHLGIAGSAVGLLIGLLYLKARFYLWISIGVFVICWIAPIAALIGLIFSGLSFDDYYEAMLALIYIPSVITFFTLLRSIRKHLTLRLNRNIAALAAIGLCVLVPVFMIGLTMYYVLLSTELSDGILKVLIYINCIPLLVTLIIIWVFVHNQFFHKPEEAIKAEMQLYLGEGVPEFDVQALIKNKPDYFSAGPSKMKGILKYTHVVSSFTLIGILLALEVGLLTLLVDCINGIHGNDVLYLSIFYMVMLPVFLICGLMFSSWNLHKNDKFWSAPLIGYALPSLAVEPLCYWLYQYDSTSLIAVVVSIGYPASIAYWLLMSMLRLQNQRRYQLFSALCCMIVLVPFGYLIPFNSVGSMKTTTFWVFMGLLCL